MVVALAGGILLSPLDASAQKVSAGVVGGGSLTDGFRDLTFFELVPRPEPGSPPFPAGTRFWSPSKDWVIGGMLEVRFNSNWSLEVNGLFRQLNGRWASVWQDRSQSTSRPHPVVTWQFPILAKYRFQGRRVKPFLAAGPSFRTTGNLNSSDPSHHGIAAGAGFEMTWRGMKIAPAARYTLWAGDRYRGVGAHTAPDQVEVLVGLSRAGESDWRPLGRHVSLGFTLGTNLTGNVRPGTISHEGQPPSSPAPPVISSARSFIFGPTVEVRLPHRLSMEVDALNRPISMATEGVYPDGTRFRWTYRPTTWAFPILAKYRFPFRGLEPFIAFGPSFRLRQSLADSSPYGLAIASGLEIHVGQVRIAPAIRYTHWAPDRPPFRGPFRNQAEGLVGFSF